MTCQLSHVPAKNGLALAALILGIFGLVLAPIGIGVLLGITAIILGIIALHKPVRRGLAITGIVTGALSIPMAFLGLLRLTILLPALSAARGARGNGSDEP